MRAVSLKDSLASAGMGDRDVILRQIDSHKNARQVGHAIKAWFTLMVLLLGVWSTFLNSPPPGRLTKLMTCGTMEGLALSFLCRQDQHSTSDVLK